MIKITLFRIYIAIARHNCPCVTVVDGKFPVYALSAHGKVVGIFNLYLWAERLWKYYANT